MFERVEAWKIFGPVNVVISGNEIFMRLVQLAKEFSPSVHPEPIERVTRAVHP